MKTVAYTREALKNLRKHGNVAERIMSAIDTYAGDSKAHANNVTQLVGSAAKRLRVGDFRVIFDESDTTITVTKVAARGNAY